MPLVKSLEKIDLEGLLDLVTPLLEEVQDLDLTGLVDAVKPLLNTVKKMDIQGIVDQVEPLITPKSVKGIVGLLGNAQDLLTKTFVSQTSELIDDAAPVRLTPLQLWEVLCILTCDSTACRHGRGPGSRGSQGVDGLMLMLIPRIHIFVHEMGRSLMIDWAHAPATF